MDDRKNERNVQKVKNKKMVRKEGIDLRRDFKQNHENEKKTKVRKKQFPFQNFFNNTSIYHLVILTPHTPK